MKWEYAVITADDLIEFRDRLDKLGIDKWELVSVVMPDRSQRLIAYLKRPLQDEPEPPRKAAKRS